MTQQELDNILKWREIWADNTDPENPNKGILSFSQNICSDRIDKIYGVGKTHVESYTNFLNLYNTSRRFSTERQLQIKEPRGFAKSTRFLHVIPAYCMAFNGNFIKLPNGERVFLNEDFIVLCSETNSFATNWVMALRALTSNSDFFKGYFGVMKPVSIRDESGLWRRDTFICNKKVLQSPYTGKNVTVAGRGVGQQIRGYNISGRPTLIIFDDIYSKNNTITPESRNKVRYWFDNDTINTLDHNKGKCVLVGTMLHEDTVFTDNEKSSGWTCLEEPVMEKDKFMYIINNYCTINRDNRTCTIPDSGTCDDLEAQGYITNWRAKFPLEFMLQKFQQAIEKGNETGLWQEYFHEVLAEADKQIKRGMMKHAEFYLVSADVGGQRIPYIKHILEDGTEVFKNVNLTVAIDTAISEKETSDDTALVWIAMTSRREIYIIEARSGKYGIRDNIKQDSLHLYNDRRVLVNDTSVLEQIGGIDETFRMIKHFNPYVIIETNKGGTNWVRAFKIACKDFNKRLRCFEFVAKTEKVSRILDALLPYYETRSVFHSSKLEKLERQLEMLKKAAHDDEADAYATAVAHTRPPAEIPYPMSKKKEPVNQRERINNKRRANTVNDDWTTAILPSV